MTNPLDSATPEQKLSILTNELLTPIEIIKGIAYLIKKDIEANNIDTDELLERINKIIEKADWVRKLREEIVKA